MRGIGVVAAAFVMSVAATTGGTVSVARGDPAPPCPVLLAIGVQGPGQASADGSDTTDSGLLGEVLRPLATAPEGTVERVYVRFAATLNGVGTDEAGQSPYQRSIAAGVTELNRVAAEFVARCPQGRIAVLGNAHGAQVASQFAQQTGRSGAGVPADKVAAVVLFGDPDRDANTPLLPGASGRSVPNPAPGTTGDAVTALAGLVQQPATGAGINTARSTTRSGYGSLSGRVASFCAAGDLACDTPTDAPILRVVDNILGTAEDSGGDPLRALASVTQALAFTAIKTVTSVVNNDVSGTSLSSVSLSSQTSLAQRVAEASDPRTPLNIDNVMKAVLKIGTIAVNAVVTVAKTVLTPANITEIAAAGLSNPAAGLAVLGTKLLGALPQLVPPSTATRLVGQAFTAVTSTVTDNTGLIDTTNWVRYSDALASRGTYKSDPVTATGQSPVQYATAWLQALTDDLAAAPDTASVTATSSPSSIPPSPTPTIATTTPAPTSR
ncbi:cutinase family protein (plasmid) [Nocardia sp. NBC_01377]